MQRVCLVASQALRTFHKVQTSSVQQAFQKQIDRATSMQPFVQSHLFDDDFEGFLPPHVGPSAQVWMAGAYRCCP
jgi:hypothetical protein